MADASKPSHPAITIGASLAYWGTVFACALVIVGVGIFTKPQNFADFSTYVLYLDQLVHFPPDNWYFFEAFSNFFFLVIHWFIDSVFPSIVTAHYILGGIFILFMMLTFPISASSWKSVIFTFALLGPVLAFVTLRATPAYFLVALAVLYAMRRNMLAWLLLAAAGMFHASTALAVGPFVLLYFRASLPSYLQATRPATFFVGGIVVLAAVSVFIPQISNSLLSVVKSVPALAKYIAYTEEGMAADYVTSVSHYIFLAFIVLYTAAFFIFSKDDNVEINLYILLSFATYIALFFVASPVAAFRQTPFWLLPMTALFPWQRARINGMAAIPFVIFCIGLFVFQFDQVYS